MTADEANELVSDLERAGVRVLGVEPCPPYAGDPDGWQVRCWCEQPAHEYLIEDAAGFREAVRAGLIPDILRNALG